jgi:proteasome alpha subunit
MDQGDAGLAVFTPYDWQEGIGNRAQYIEGRLAAGVPVLAVSLPDGILVYTFRRQARKIYEIYDRLVFAGVGQQADVEAMRMSALEFASREGYNRSDEDVTIHRVATAMSAPLKRAFSDFSASPLVARSLFAEVGATPADDLYYTLDYDGDYALSRQRAAIAGTLEAGADLEKALTDFSETDPEAAMETLKSIWVRGVDPEGHKSEDEVFEGLRTEAMLVERSGTRENRFRMLTEEEF